MWYLLPKTSSSVIEGARECKRFPKALAADNKLLALNLLSFFTTGDKPSGILPAVAEVIPISLSSVVEAVEILLKLGVGVGLGLGVLAVLDNLLRVLAPRSGLLSNDRFLKI